MLSRSVIRIAAIYGRVFSVNEIGEQQLLRWSFWILLFGASLSLSRLAESNAITIEESIRNAQICWPHFQSCGEWYFFNGFPANSQGIFFMFLLAVICTAAYSALRGSWLLAHVAFLLLWMWRVIFTFFLTMKDSGNYDYEDIILGAALLFFPNKEKVLKISFVLIYFLSVTLKFNDGWISGAIFTGMLNVHGSDLPIFGNMFVPILTNSVIIMQIFGSWFLLSGTKHFQRAVFALFLVFHIYSAALVGYRYPMTVIPMLLVLFGPTYNYIKIQFTRRDAAAVIFWAMLFLGQFVSIIIPGDARWTQEGRRYGFYMFDASHDCRSRATIHYANGLTRQLNSVTYRAIDRCDPYQRWFPMKQMCASDDSISSISWRFEHAVNGYRPQVVVEENNICSLNYEPFSKNYWIRSP
jgi:hypothetical protein